MQAVKTTVLGRKSPLAVPAVGLGCMGMVSAYRVLNELYPLLDFLEYGYDVRVQLYLKLPRKPCNPTTLDFREGRANCAAMYGSAQVLDTRPRAGGSGPELVPGDTSIFRERGGQAGVCGVAGGATSHKAQGHGNRAIKKCGHTFSGASAFSLNRLFLSWASRLGGGPAPYPVAEVCGLAAVKEKQ